MRSINIVFIGINPSPHTSRSGIAFSHPTNTFWPLLEETGIIDASPSIEFKLNPPFEIFNLITRVTSSSADLSEKEMINAVPKLIEQLQRIQPKYVCFVGICIFKAFLKYLRQYKSRNIILGLQSKRYLGMTVHVMPSTSQRGVTYTRKRKKELLMTLATALKEDGNLFEKITK